MRPTSYVATSLALAITVYVTALATKARAETRIVTPVRAWIHYVTERSGDSVQHITTGYYLGINPVEAMSRCRQDVGSVLFAADLEAQLVIEKKLKARDQNRILVAPRCLLQKPATWVDGP